MSQEATDLFPDLLLLKLFQVSSLKGPALILTRLMVNPLSALPHKAMAPALGPLFCTQNVP
jgi:hypothetical protein